jgi:PAB-dependent poly(A)-specific ribonuclease subunit 2
MMEPHDYGLSGLGNAMSDVTLTDVNGGHVETNDVPLRGNPYSSVYNTRHTPTFPNMRPDYLFLKYVLSDSGSHARTQPPVTSLCFDRQEELLWMGNEGGHVTSYYGLDMVKYTSFQVHSENDIRAQLTGDYGLLSLTKNSLRLSLRRGLTAFNHTSDHLNDMYCMSLTENPSIILMAGQQSELLDFDLNLMKPVRITNLENDPSANSLPGCMIIRSHPRFVCCGDATGKVSTY